MIAFEIKINGEKVLLAGIEDWDLIHANILARREAETNDYDLKIGGLPIQTEKDKLEHVRWADIKLNLNDEITIKIVEIESADNPIKRYRSDNKVQEDPFTDEEIFEMQKQDYLILKEKFKNEDFA